ncbi:MAG TPA: glycosyltransferase family 9 protein [Vitreimonas sp.]|uniref:glycosyltransferase family 9 protein n=1 Tax=Vitreimonas sp. TaxID=3069702 RepID=UPI002D60AF9F|nr:glycosyltransferase family 9 protein [Vitreimonas sp.]HYD88219.1 glycosyltransferase family 9 protein [Vitreimonas sp.]
MIWRKSAASSDSETNSAKRVLVIQLGGLGAFVMALAAAKRIREHHVGARITLLTTEATKELAEKAPYFDTVEADGKPTEPQAITKLIARIRAAKYDMIYDLEGSSRTNNYFQGLRPWPPKWSGPTPGASHTFLDAARTQMHPLDRYAAQLAAAGLPPEPVMSDLTWVRHVLRDPPRLSPDYFGIRGPYIVLLPRGSNADPARRWDDAKYADLARRAASQGVTPVVLGGADERPAGAAVAKLEPRAKNLVTRPDLFQTVGLLERAAFAVGDDVDLMHMAAATGVPCLVFLSALSHPELSAPRGRGGVVTLTASVISDLPVEQVERQLRNCGVLRQAATA